MARLQGHSAHITTVAADLRGWTLPPGAKPFDKVEKIPPGRVIFLCLCLFRQTVAWPLSFLQRFCRHRQVCMAATATAAAAKAASRMLSAARERSPEGPHHRQPAGRMPPDYHMAPGRLPGHPLCWQRLVKPPQHRAPGVTQGPVPGPEWARCTEREAVQVVTWVHSGSDAAGWALRGAQRMLAVPTRWGVGLFRRDTCVKNDRR